MATIKVKAIRQAIIASAILNMLFLIVICPVQGAGCALEMNSILKSEANEIWVNVVAQEANNLDTYQAEVNFDPVRMVFMGGYEDYPSEGIVNFLKKRGGTSIGFQAVKAADGKINISNALIGNNTDQAPEGSGIIALLKFKIADEAPNNFLKLSNVVFLDSWGNSSFITEANLKNTGYNLSFGIEGYILLQDGSTPVSNAAIQVSGKNAVYSDAAGYYKVTDVSEGTYTVSAHETQYVFDPSSITVTLSSDRPVAQINFYEKVSADTDRDGISDEWEMQHFGDLSSDGSGDYDNDGFSDREEYESGTNPTEDELAATFNRGLFTVGESGFIEIDWLYDGGMYQGELGIFSVEGMEELIPDREKFVKEAVRRAMSDSEEGYVVLTDSKEGARFSGSLGEPSDWNKGPYVGVKKFKMRPEGTFAIILVPDSTLEELAKTPLTTVSGKRPLFSVVLSNPFHGTHLGQVADINGSGNAFVYEDMEITSSDKDYNDLIIRVIGATVEIPTINAVVGKDKWFDWRTETDLGKLVVEHLETPPVKEKDLWVSVSLDTMDDDLMVYDSQNRVCGKEGCYIPGADFNIGDEQRVSLPQLADGETSYRIMLRGATGEPRNLTVKGHEGNAEISSDMKEAAMEAHKIFTSDLTASSSGGSLTVVFGELKEHTAPDGTPLHYDFDLDRDIDDSDVKKVLSRLGASVGDQNYDPVYDLDDDGCIELPDLMTVKNSMSVAP